MEKDNSLDLENEVCTEEMMERERREKAFAQKRADAMEKALSAYDAYRSNHGGSISREMEMKIAKPYLDAVWEDQEFSRRRVDEQSLQSFRGRIKGPDNKRGFYREKKDGKYTDTVIDAGHTFEANKIDNIRRSLDDISDANRASAKRVDDYKKYIAEGMQEAQTTLQMGDGTGGVTP